MPLVFAPLLLVFYAVSKTLLKKMSVKVNLAIFTGPSIAHHQFRFSLLQTSRMVSGLQRRDTFINASFMMISLLYIQQARRVMEVNCIGLIIMEIARAIKSFEGFPVQGGTKRSNFSR